MGEMNEKALQFWEMFAPICLFSLKSQDACKTQAGAYIQKLHDLDFKILREVFLDYLDDANIIKELPRPEEIRMKYYKRINAMNQKKDDKLAGPEPPEHISRRAKLHYELFQKIEDECSPKAWQIDSHDPHGFANVAYCLVQAVRGEAKLMENAVKRDARINK